MSLTRRRVRADSVGVLGDMEYLAASGLYVPAGLIKTTGKVPTLQADGTVGYQAGASGATPEWVTYHPDTPPTSPVTFGGVIYDLEFKRDNVLSGGTILGTPAVNPSIVNRALRIVPDATTSAAVKGIEWACPATAFTLTCKVYRRTNVNQTGLIGPMLRRNASGAGNFITFCHQVNTSWTATSFTINRYTALTTRSSFASAGDFTGIFVPYYIQMTYDGTNIISRASFSGHPSSFTQLASEAAATFLGGAPGRFGITLDNFGTSTANIGYCEWVRFT